MTTPFTQSSNNSLNIERDADLRILFIGNSFTYHNSLPELVRQSLLTMPDYHDVVVAMDAPSGYRLIQHTDEALHPDSKEPIREYLVTGSPALRAWDLVVVQEQSQTMGFPNDWDDKRALNQALFRLGQAIRDNDSRLLLMMTWGLTFGDSQFPEYYPDFLTMTEKVHWGYTDARNRLEQEGIVSEVAKVGFGWKLVYQDIVSQGGDPLADGSRFRQLYAEDNKHPALAGSYLAAHIIIAEYLDCSVVGNSFVPEGLDTDFAHYLREIADSVVLG